MVKEIQYSLVKVKILVGFWWVSVMAVVDLELESIRAQKSDYRDDKVQSQN